MRLKKKIIKELLDIKVVLSVIGALFIAFAGLVNNIAIPLFIGHIIWLIASILWLKYFYNRKDDNAVVMYWIWVLQAIVGIITSGMRL